MHTTVVAFIFLAPLIIAVFPSTVIFAPIFLSSEIYLYLLSKIFSTIIDVPLAFTNIVAKICCKSVGNPGYVIVFISIDFNFFGAFKVIFLLFISILHPVSSNLFITAVKCSGITLSNVTFPPVAATAHKIVPASILSGIIL